MTEQRFSFKAFISFALLVGGIIVATAGVVLYVAPPGRVANMIDWRFLGLSRTEWGAIRTIFALFFIVAAPIHLYFNWGVFKTYLSQRAAARKARRWELGSAVVMVALVFGLTLQGARPFSSIIRFGERVSASWTVPDNVPQPAQPTDRQPATAAAEPGAERAPDQTGATDETPATDQARATDQAPATDQPRTAGTGTGTGGGTGSGATPQSGTGEGLGRLTLEAFCQREGITLVDATARLEAAGITASPNDLLRSLAASAGKVPNELAAIARGP